MNFLLFYLAFAAASYLAALWIFYFEGDPRISVKFIKQDLWIGVYYKYEEENYVQKYRIPAELTIYICLIPCFPIIIKEEMK